MAYKTNGFATFRQALNWLHEEGNEETKRFTALLNPTEPSRDTSMYGPNGKDNVFVDAVVHNLYRWVFDAKDSPYKLTITEGRIIVHNLNHVLLFAVVKSQDATYRWDAYLPFNNSHMNYTIVENF